MLLALSGQVFLDGTIVMIRAFKTSGPKFASGICWVSYKPLVFFLSCPIFFCFRASSYFGFGTDNKTVFDIMGPCCFV